MTEIDLDDELKRVLLQLERDLIEQARLRTLLSEAATTVAGRRRDVQTLKGRIKRKK